MTKNRAVKRAARNLAARTGLKYTDALRLAETRYDPCTTPDGWSRFHLGRVLDDSGTLTLDLERTGHVLLTGAASTGKTTTMRTIAAQALVKGWDVVICDDSGSAWSAWTPWGAECIRLESGPGIVDYVPSSRMFRRLLEQYVGVVEDRYAQLDEAGVPRWTELEASPNTEAIRPLLVVVDGVDDMYRWLNGVNDGARHLLALLARGPRAGVHVIFSAQVPERLPYEVLSHAGARIALGDTRTAVRERLFNDASPIPLLPLYGDDGRKAHGRALVQTSPWRVCAAQLASIGGDTNVRAFLRAQRAEGAARGAGALRACDRVVRWDGHTLPVWSQFYLGINPSTGEDITFDVNSPSPHVFVTGQDGSGKTSTMSLIAVQALAKGWELAICDGRSSDWRGWTRRLRHTHRDGLNTGADPLQAGDGRPGVVEHALEVFGICDVLRRCEDEMRRRQDIIAVRGLSSWTDLPEAVRVEENVRPLMVVFDHALGLLVDRHRGDDPGVVADNEARAEISQRLKTVVAHAGPVGIHVVLSVLRPDTVILCDDWFKEGFGTRIACGPHELLAAGIVFGSTAFDWDAPYVRDAVNPPLRGRALVGPAGGPVTACQVAWLGTEQADLRTVAPFAPVLPPDPEVFCPACRAGVTSSEHHERCVLTGLAEDGEPVMYPLTPSRELFEANHELNVAWYKNRDRKSGRRRALVRPVAPVDLPVGTRFKFYGDRRWWTVQAVSDGFVVATRTGDFGRGGRYTVIAWGEGRRGPHGSWGHGAATREQCEQTAAALAAGHIYMSERHTIHLDLDLDRIERPRGA